MGMYDAASLRRPKHRRLDYVLVAPVHRYVGEGYYLLSDPLRESASVFSCSGSGLTKTPHIRLRSHHQAYPDHLVSMSYFEEHVLAQVVMIGNVVRPDLLSEARRHYQVEA